MTRRYLYLLAVLLRLTSPSLSYSDEPRAAADTIDEGPLLVAPFTQEEAAVAQKKCGQTLGLPVEITNSIGMKLRLIPAGEFMMGSAKSPQEIVRLFDLSKFWAKQLREEHPQHRVRITKSFYVGMHEVTSGEFRQFAEANGYKTDAEKNDTGGSGWHESTGKMEISSKYTWRNAGFAQTDAHPVVNVSWNDAAAFCRWLSRKESETYRLPTEAEWEYACRAGTTTLYYHGGDPEGLSRSGNVADATAKKKLTNYQSWRYLEADDGHVFTAPVGGFRPNGFGLYDMHGNVWEWCADWYDAEYYTGSSIDDPTGPDTAKERVGRGGSWVNDAAFCRAALRNRFESRRGFDALGFRVAAGPPGK